MEKEFEKLMSSYWETYQNYLDSMPLYKAYVVSNNRMTEGFKSYLINARDSFMDDCIKTWEKEKNA